MAAISEEIIPQQTTTTATTTKSTTTSSSLSSSSCEGVDRISTAAMSIDDDCDLVSNDSNGTGIAALHNGREARNMAEKQRRDKLNASIQELAKMVPHVAESTRRLDKTAVLRFATHGLRLQYVFGKSALRRKRKICLKSNNGSKSSTGVAGARNSDNIVESPHITDALMQLLDSFFLTLTCNGQIVLISISVEQLLGHCQSDLYGQNILQITHPDDQALLRQQLIPRDIEALFYRGCSDEGNDNMASVEGSGNSSDAEGNSYLYGGASARTLAHLAAIDERLRLDRRCFTVRLARATTRAEATRSYELVKIDGCFRRSDSSVTGGIGAGCYPIVSQLIRRSRNANQNNNVVLSSLNGVGNAPNVVPYLPQHDAIAQAALHGISGNDIVLVAMARIIREPRVAYRQPEPNQLEYRTRHLIDGRIIDCDQRIGIVAGYMKDEVRNLSPFSFMHQDDVRWVIVALRQMYDCSSDYGESCYRLLSRNGRFIYLQTKGYLEIDKNTNKVHSFLCINTLLDEEEGKRKVQEMKDKFSTIINAKIPDRTSVTDLPASRNPQQLERIVLYLIENLQKRNDNNLLQQRQIAGGADLSSVDGYSENIHVAATSPATGGEGNDMQGIIKNGNASPRSPATTMSTQPVLALVPPEPSSVKNSITKSVNVVNITAAKNLQYQQRCNKKITNNNHADNNQKCNTVIRPMKRCLSESSSLSPASSVELIDEVPSSAAVTPPTTPPALPIVLTKVAMSSTLPMNASPRPSVLQKALSSKTKTTKSKVPRNGIIQHTLPISPSEAISTSTSPTPTPTPTATPTSTPKHTPTSTPAKLHAVVSSSLRELDTCLISMGEKAQTLCTQRTLINAVSNKKCDHQMNAIMLEHQVQKQILVNIKNEYDVHVQQHQQHQQQQHQQQHASVITSTSATVASTAIPTQMAATLSSPRQRQGRPRPL